MEVKVTGSRTRSQPRFIHPLLAVCHLIAATIIGWMDGWLPPRLSCANTLFAVVGKKFCIRLPACRQCPMCQAAAVNITEGPRTCTL